MPRQSHTRLVTKPVQNQRTQNKRFLKKKPSFTLDFCFYFAAMQCNTKDKLVKIYTAHTTLGLLCCLFTFCSMIKCHVARTNQSKSLTAIPEGLYDQSPDVFLIIIRTLSSCAYACLLYTSPSPRDGLLSRMPSSA